MNYPNHADWCRRLSEMGHLDTKHRHCTHNDRCVEGRVCQACDGRKAAGGSGRE